MKKIALIMDGWKRFFTYAWPAGVLERIRETNEDVNLYIFNSSGDWSKDEDYNIGEYNIYRLPRMEEQDLLTSITTTYRKIMVVWPQILSGKQTRYIGRSSLLHLTTLRMIRQSRRMYIPKRILRI